MTPILKFAACVLIIGIVIFFSCKKDSEGADNHFPPVAKAGPDVSLTISSCSAGVVALDGTASTDADGNIRSYRWTQISGPGSSTLTDYTSAKANVKILSGGQYVFELKVTDAGGLSSKDTMLINVAGPFGEYDLDVTINGSFKFTHNYKDCYYSQCSYIDLTTIQDSFDFPPIGEFNFSVYESADTAISGYNHFAFINFYASNNSGPGASGRCSVNFKELIHNGGGSFNGTFTASGGSATTCGGQNIYANLAPLTVTGNLDATAHTITLNLKGKIYF